MINAELIFRSAVGRAYKRPCPCTARALCLRSRLNDIPRVSVCLYGWMGVRVTLRSRWESGRQCRCIVSVSLGAFVMFFFSFIFFIQNCVGPHGDTIVMSLVKCDGADFDCPGTAPRPWLTSVQTTRLLLLQLMMTIGATF